MVQMSFSFSAVPISPAITALISPPHTTSIRHRRKSCWLIWLMARCSSGTSALRYCGKLSFGQMGTYPNSYTLCQYLRRRRGAASCAAQMYANAFSIFVSDPPIHSTGKQAYNVDACPLRVHLFWASNWMPCSLVDASAVRSSPAASAVRTRSPPSL